MPEPQHAIFFTDFSSSHIPEILEEVYLKKIYEPFLLGRQDQFIVDAGANIGLTANYFKDYAREVFAIEPARVHQETIKQLIAFNKITNITLCPYALAGKTGKTKFYHQANTTAHSLSLVTNEADYETVQTLSFDEFMVRNKLDHIDLLKLDVEGAECEVIASDGFKEYAPAIRAIVFEYHNWAKCSQAQFGSLLTDLGFRVKWNTNTGATTGSAVRV